MAVYKRRFQHFSGQLTNPRFRFLVLTRYAIAHLFHSKLFAAFFVICFAAPLVAAIIIYLHYNTMGLKLIGETMNSLIPIDAEFFQRFLAIQTSLGMLLTAFVGPGLISPDLVNNALPLYFSRPFTRKEYVLGKITVLFGFLSVITWVPMLLLFLFQGSLTGVSWMVDNFRIAVAIWFSSWAWILVLALLALAFSAWVRWRPVAGFLIFGYLLVSAAFAEAVNQILEIRWGTIFNTSQLIKILWESLFFKIPDTPDIPVWCAVLILLAQCAFFLYLLSRKIRAYVVVR